MKLWQAHLALAQSLGDPITPTGSPTSIPDGVRYSKKLRDSYLYRAMMKTLSSILTQIASLPKHQQDLVLRKVLPNFSRTYSDFKPLTPQQEYDLGERAVHIYSVQVASTILPVDKRPVLYSWKTNHQLAATTSSLHMVEPDPMFTTSMNADQTATIVKLWTNADDWAVILPDPLLDSVLISYIPLPRDPSEAPDGDEPLDFEPLLLEKVISTAVLLARVDSQDFNDLSVLTQFLQGPSGA